MSRRPRPSGAMHVVTNKRQGRHREYVTHLLRRSYREDGKVKNETLANLSHLPPEVIELIRGTLRGESYIAAGEAFEIERSLSAGHVIAALSMARRLDLARLLDRKPSRERDLVMAMICERVIAPARRLAVEQPRQIQATSHRQRRYHVPRRQRALDLKRLTSRDVGLPAQRAADQLDYLRRQVREVRERLVLDLAVLAVGAPQQVCDVLTMPTLTLVGDDMHRTRRTWTTTHTDNIHSVS